MVARVTDAEGASSSASVSLDVLGATASLSQGSPKSVTLKAGAGYRGQLKLEEPASFTGAVSFTVTKANKVVAVSSSGAVTVARTAPYGTFVTSGSDVDAHGDGGAWTLKVKVTRPTHLVVASSTLPTAIVGKHYHAALVAFSPTGTPSWTVAPGSRLPGGLSLTKAGILAGTPAIGTGGTHRVSLRARKGSSGVTVEREIVVDVLPFFTSASQDAAAAGQPVDVHVAASGAPDPVISAVAGTLPSWLVLTPGTGGTATLTGSVPSDASGSYVVTLDATNAVGSATQRLTIDVEG